MTVLEFRITTPTVISFGLTSAGYISPTSLPVINGTTYTVPAGKRLMGFGIDKAVGARTLSVGTTASGTDIVDSEAIPSNTDYDIGRFLYTSTALTLYFSGFTGNIRTYIY